MSENNKREVRTPIDVILEMARGEIKNHVAECMKANGIPPAFMAYLLKSITLDIYEMKSEQLAEYYVELQKNILESEEENQEE